MSLPRKDIKVFFDPPEHEAVRRHCEHLGVTMSGWIEQLVMEHLRERVEEATVTASLAPLLGITRDRQGSPGAARDRAGKPGKSGESGA